MATDALLALRDLPRAALGQTDQPQTQGAAGDRAQPNLLTLDKPQAALLIGDVPYGS